MVLAYISLIYVTIFLYAHWKFNCYFEIVFTHFLSELFLYLYRFESIIHVFYILDFNLLAITCIRNTCMQSVAWIFFFCATNNPGVLTLMNSD